MHTNTTWGTAQACERREITSPRTAYSVSPATRPTGQLLSVRVWTVLFVAAYAFLLFALTYQP